MTGVTLHPVSARLFVSDLRQCTTSLPAIEDPPGNSGSISTMKHLAQSFISLPEKDIADSYTTLTHLVGNVILKIVQSGHELLHANTSSSSHRQTRRRVSIAEQILFSPLTIESLLSSGGPYALALQLKIYEESFQKRGTREDIRYDVFYNGQLTHSDYIAFPLLFEQDGERKFITTTFSGLRIDTYTEHPWILVPVGLSPIGEIPTGERVQKTPDQVRWSSIGASILQ
jgi:hypothetical protein